MYIHSFRFFYFVSTCNVYNTNVFGKRFNELDIDGTAVVRGYLVEKYFKGGYITENKFDNH